MDAQLIQETMTRYGISRDRAIALIMGNQSTLSPFQVNYTPQQLGSNSFLANNQITSVGNDLSSDIPTVPSSYNNSLTQEPITINPSQDISQLPIMRTSIDPNIVTPQGINWGELAPNQNIMPENYAKDFTPMTTSPVQSDIRNINTSPDYGIEVGGDRALATTAPKNNSDLNALEQAAAFASMLNPYGSDLETELYTLGAGIGRAVNGNGSAGNTLGIIGAAGAALLGGTRSALSGYSTQIANNRYWQWMQERRKRLEKQYEAQRQTGNTQATMQGGITQS